MQDNLLQIPETVLSQPEPFITPHIAHQIEAGFPSPATDYMEAGLDLNTFLIKHKAATFIFTVKGNSMQGAGILSGDKLVVDRSIEPRHKHIVVAVINNEYTVKRLYKRAGVIQLMPENAEFEPIRLCENDELVVWGVVVGVVRQVMT